MVVFRYYKWDGSQEPFRPGADDLMDALSENLYEHGDLQRALRDLFRRGMEGREGQRMSGLQDMQRRLNQQRREKLKQNDLDSVIDDIQEKLEEVVQEEREGVERSVREAQDKLDYALPDEQEQLQGLMDYVQKRADRASETLDNLPESPAGQIQQLQDYDFVDSGAREKFDELMNMLRQQMMQNFAQEQSQMLQNITPEQQQTMRDMLRDLNEMMQQRAQGQEPDFQSFMDKWGDFFPDKPESLDELLDMLEQQMAQMQSLLNSMSPEARQQLMQMIQESLDQETLNEMAQLARNMEQLRPGAMQGQSYPFSGEDPMNLGQAMDLMGELQQIDEMESALQQAGRSGDIDSLDPQQVEEQLGPEARDTLEQLQEAARRLEEEGYIQRKDERWELTPRAIRKMGEKALREVFGSLQKDRMGGHQMQSAGMGGEPTGATLAYEPGEPFDVNLYRSLHNAVKRQGAGTPVRMSVDDFEVDELEHSTEAATVLLLDQSSSMHHYGRWGAAKKVAMALQSLIQRKFPRDRLFIVGFSDLAQELKDRDLPSAAPNDWVQGTNMHHAMMLARRLLSRERAATKQIIMITDGEPTAHLEQGYPFFSYPPSHETVNQTLMEVRRCSQAGITINTFMLERSTYLARFIDYVTQINRGRAFYTDPESLGNYILVDYVTNRRKQVA